jgi:hypothetical protein
MLLGSALGLLVFALLVDAIFNRSKPSPEDPALVAELAAQGDAEDTASDVRSYLNFVRQHGTEIGAERLATSDALIGLARAIGQLAGPEGFSDTEGRVAFLDLSSRGRVLAQTSPDDLTYADIAREAFVWAARLLEMLQTRDRPHDAALAAVVKQLDATARSIRSDESLADQQADVLRFFRQASRVVQRLALAKQAAPRNAAGTS